MFEGQDTRSVVEWFDLGGSLPLADTTSADDVVKQARGVQGLVDLTMRAGLAGKPASTGAPFTASAVDFVLEGLYAQKKISRTDDRGYSAAEGAPRRTTRREEPAVEESFQIPGAKKKYYN
ncbi:MAG TPA: hypothetical protein VKB36_20445, partial [Vicinamibacterales bacterium]|nr:hypothetical protein [Vicinamibacterales bacterium]